MNFEKLLVLFVLIDFAALNIWAISSQGLSGFVEFMTTMPSWGVVLSADLIIAIVLLTVGMWRDARSRGEKAPVGYMVLSLLTGSIGPLAYMLRRKEQAS